MSGERASGLSVWRAWRVTVALAVSAWPAGAIGRLAVEVVNRAGWGLLPAVALRQVLDRGGGGWTALLVVSVVAAAASSPFWEYYQRGLIYRADQAALRAVMGAALAPAGIDHLESAGFADAMEVVRGASRKPGLLSDWMVGAVGGAVTLGVSTVVLAGVHPLLMLPLMGAAALGLVHAGTRRRAILVSDKALPGQRLAQRLVALGTMVAPAKEVRAFGLGPWLVARHRAVTDDVASRLISGERGPVMASAASGVVQALLLGLGVAWLVRLAATGQATAGDLALGLVLLRSAVDAASHFGSSLGSDLARNTHAARNYLWLLDYVPDVRAPADPRPVPPDLRRGIELCDRRGIELCDVTFTYRGQASPALEGVTLTLTAGTAVALVGDNGAGKSTLVKLLCRFYDPSSGSVTVDGTDLRSFDPDQWRAATTGAFQDFMCFRFLAGESVGAGDLPRIDDLGRVMAAAVEGGAAPFIERLADGYATQLGRELPGGADLSVGQWQKLALSRSLMRAAPLLTVLDEPTAALDARAEHDLFELYAERAVAARERGGVTVVVSHRFSTVRMADLIVVLDEGRVVETGPHAELIACDLDPLLAVPPWR